MSLRLKDHSKQKIRSNLHSVKRIGAVVGHKDGVRSNVKNGCFTRILAAPYAKEALLYLRGGVNATNRHGEQDYGKRSHDSEP